MTSASGQERTHRTRDDILAALGWSGMAATFALPVICESLARESAGEAGGDTLLVRLSLVVVVAATILLVVGWRRVVRGIGNRGLATIASIAGLQFAVSYAARLIGSIFGAILGPLYVFVDGLGSKGLSCLFLGVLVALLPRPGALTLSLVTLFVLNVITSGQVGLIALVFVAVSVALHESFAALLGVTIGRPPRSTTDAADWSFVIRAGLAIGLANALAMYAQYALYEALLRLFFDEWYKLAVSLITGLVYGGVGAACGAILGLRLRRIAP
jgi:hypothetical protein